MAKAKGSPKTGGRKKGSMNVVTRTAKEALSMAFDKLGGAEALARWGVLNRTEFYKLWSKTLPLEVSAKIEEDATVTVVFRELKSRRDLKNADA